VPSRRGNDECPLGGELASNVLEVRCRTVILSQRRVGRAQALASL
jgi:hypothetical protein